MNRPRRLETGFTLIEVLAALAIAATGLLAVSKTITSTVEVADATSTRSVAYWVAANHMTELRLSDTWLATGNSSREVEMGGRAWRVDRGIESTPDEDVVKVVITVFEAALERPAVARLSGYLARLDPPRPRLEAGPGANGRGSS